jgi:hypothetical protein
VSSIHIIYSRLSPRFRARRLQWFTDVFPPLPQSTVLDVGGYPWFWKDAAGSYKITLLNPHVLPGLADQFGDKFEYVVGDGCRLGYSDRSFDIVFSNSVIEHVGSYERQQAFAAEARRVGRALWIQTPAREFFIEPHLLTPFIHFLPLSLQAHLLRYGTVWGLMNKPSPSQVAGFLEEVRLLSYSEMKKLFPDCEIRREKFMGFTKSYIAIRGSAQQAPRPWRVPGPASLEKSSVEETMARARAGHLPAGSGDFQ